MMANNGFYNRSFGTALSFVNNEWNANQVYANKSANSAHDITDPTKMTDTVATTTDMRRTRRQVAPASTKRRLAVIWNCP
jgi:hypothetical protein